MITIAAVREYFINQLRFSKFTTDRTGAKTIEMIGASFIADEDAIFGKLIPFQGIESNKFIKAVVIYGENPLSQLDGTIGTTK